MKAALCRFIDVYYRELIEGNVAVFAGAGLSAPAGFVDWRGLLQPLAEELELDIDRETDLVSVAQFHVNKHNNNRHRLHAAIIEALAADNPPTRNHRILAGLPIPVWWTTNYDKLIETALKEAGKVADAKSTVLQLANTRPRRDAIVYKMHGDVDRPDEAVVTRDDYERYARDRGAFLATLAGDLVSKTFLFLGFSFTDPNLEQVLAQVRLVHTTNQRGHFAIFRTRQKLAGEDEASFEHAKRRQALVLQDLGRFNVTALLVDRYEEITEVLQELERRYRRRTVFVSSSAADFDPWGEASVIAFMRSLGAALVEIRARVATGFGDGVGDPLLSGALEGVMNARGLHIDEALVIRPFPQQIEDRVARAQIWRTYRQDIMHGAGVALFLFGNKRRNGEPAAEATGMIEEFEIARERGLLVLPIGATGSTAQKLWEIVSGDMETYLGQLNNEQRAMLADLARPTGDLMTLVGPIITLLKSLGVGGR